MLCPSRGGEEEEAHLLETNEEEEEEEEKEEKEEDRGAWARGSAVYGACGGAKGVCLRPTSRRRAKNDDLHRL